MRLCRTTSRHAPTLLESGNRGDETMSFCAHCEGQRFDRARVLRALRQVRRDLRTGTCRTPDGALDLALEAVKSLEIPHLEWDDDTGSVVH